MTPNMIIYEMKYLNPNKQFADWVSGIVALRPTSCFDLRAIKSISLDAFDFQYSDKIDTSNKEYGI
jgi:hypothetical protein